MRFHRAVDGAQTTARCSLIVRSILSQRAVDSEASCGRFPKHALTGFRHSPVRSPGAECACAPRNHFAGRAQLITNFFYFCGLRNFNMTNTAKVEVSLIFHNTYLLVFQSASRGLPFADILQIHFHFTQFHQFVHYGINGESGSRMNL